MNPKNMDVFSKGVKRLKMKVKIPIHYNTDTQLAYILQLLKPATQAISKPYKSPKGWRVYVTVKLP